MARIAGVLFGPPGRGSFNEAGQSALERIGAELHWIEPPTPEARTAALDALCATGPDLVIAHGGQGDAPVAAIAARYPGIAFAITQGHFHAPNVACYEVLQEESAFLGGVLAASATRSGVVAHLSGERVRPGLKGRAAFAHGARTVRPDVRLLTTFCGNQHDPALAARVVEAQAAAGADVLFAMIDGGRSGAIDACRARRVAQIGNVLDWTARVPDVFIASAIADSGWGIERAAVDFAAGTMPFGATRTVGLEQPGVVSLSIAASVTGRARNLVADCAARIRSREIAIQDRYDGPEFTPPAA